MKKVLLALLATTALFNMVAANAGGFANQQQLRTTGCDYREFMYIQAPQGTHILYITSNGIRVEQTSDTSFEMVGSCSTGSEGSVIANIGIDKEHFTKITIVDGQFMWSPEVHMIKTVGGFNYTGMNHQIGTFVYTLNFDNA